MAVSLERHGYRLRERCWEALGEEPSGYEEVTGTCVPVQRVVERPRPGQAAEGTRMVSIMEEGLVEATRLLLKEALPMRTPRVATHQPQPITLRNAAALVARFHHTAP